MAKKNRKNCPSLRLILVILVLMLFLALPAGAGINFNFTNTTHQNYTISDEVLNPPNFIRFVDGNIELPTLRLEFSLNRTINSGNKTLVLSSGHFGPKVTTLPNQRVFYVVPGGIASVSYKVGASSHFANKKVNISIFKQESNNVPFFSDLSLAVLNFNDLKNTWSNSTEVLDELTTALDDVNKVNETSLTLDGSGNSGLINLALGPGNYLILVTRNTGPREIITSNNIQVLPFDSSINIGDGSNNAPKGLDLQVSISLPPSAPTENYTYITSIINKEDYLNDLGNINITWSDGQTLAQATRVNGIALADASDLTDIIPNSGIARITTDSKSANLALNTAALPIGRYLVHTAVFNSTNILVAFDQSPVTLVSAITSPVALNGTGYATTTLNIPTPDSNIIVTIPNDTRATLSDGITPISDITTYSVVFNSTLETAASGSKLIFLGKNLTLLPEGAKFTPYILIRFNYSNADIPAGVRRPPKAYWYDSSRDSWDELVTDSAGTYPGSGGLKYIEVRVPHFSTFALLGSISGEGNTGGGSGSGSSTGGGGVTTDEPFDNIAKAESYDEDLIAGKPVTYTFTDSALGVYEVAVTGKENEDDITLRVEALKDTSKNVAVQAPGVVYKNLNILIGTKKLKEAFVRFKVENAWLNSNGLEGSNLKLLKWDGSKWIQLDTAELRNDASYTYYEARTETFSHFAMSGVKAQAEPTVATTQPSVTSTSAATVTPTATGGAGAEAPQVNLSLIIGGVIVLIAIVVVIYLKKR